MNLSDMNQDQIRKAVADKYGQVATDPEGKFEFPTGREFAVAVGYPESILDTLPADCVNSFAGVSKTMLIADIQKGDIVLDLGCGAGMDSLIAGRKVGEFGQVHGIDASQDMVQLANRCKNQAGASNASFSCCYAEHLPFSNHYFDMVVSNGIFNLAPDEEAVAREVYRVLKVGGRITFSEIVLREHPAPEEVTDELSTWFKCIGGARLEHDLLDMFEDIGFTDIQVIQTGRNARTRNPHTYFITATMRKG